MIKLTLFILLGILANLACSQEFRCRSQGSFPDRTSPLCREYFACVGNKQGGLTRIWAKCSENYKFDWNLNTCVLDRFFACPNNPSDNVVAQPPLRPIVPQRPSVPQLPSVPQFPIVPQPPTNALPIIPSFVCPGSGNFPDPASTDCRRFFRCTGVGSRVTMMTCRTQRVFNWQQRRCIDDSGMDGCPANAPAFHCAGVGDFLDPTSSDCSTYYRCFFNYDGQLRRQLNICPSNEAFDHFRKRCISRKVAVCSAFSPYE